MSLIYYRVYLCFEGVCGGGGGGGVGGEGGGEQVFCVGVCMCV